jgi:hypothetical protein
VSYKYFAILIEAPFFWRPRVWFRPFCIDWLGIYIRIGRH